MTYITITCIVCGAVGKNTYSEPIATRMAKRQMCFGCSHWTDYGIKLETHHLTETIIDGYVYTPGNRTTGSFRGMAGRRFDIEYIEPSIFAGKRITTFDLWAGGQMPDWLRAKWPDTAKFLNGAEGVDLGKGGTIERCWNPSMSRAEPYPLPKTLTESSK